MLTPAQRSAWQTDGYLVLPAFKPQTELDAVTARAQALVDNLSRRSRNQTSNTICGQRVAE